MPQGLNAPKQNLEDEEALDACVQTDARWKQSATCRYAACVQRPTWQWTTPGHGARNSPSRPHTRVCIPVGRGWEARTWQSLNRGPAHVGQTHALPVLGPGPIQPDPDSIQLGGIGSMDICSKAMQSSGSADTQTVPTSSGDPTSFIRVLDRRVLVRDSLGSLPCSHGQQGPAAKERCVGATWIHWDSAYLLLAHQRNMGSVRRHPGGCRPRQREDHLVRTESSSAFAVATAAAKLISTSAKSGWALWFFLNFDKKLSLSWIYSLVSAH